MHTHAETEKAGDFPSTITIRKHTFRTDVDEEDGSTDSAPGAHDYFDASLAACKTLTATWYAKRNNMPLERVIVDITRDKTEERKGVYRLKVKVEFTGPLTDEQRKRLHAAVAKCPVHKLMTTTEVVIDTE
jgi:putative redox protein